MFNVFNGILGFLLGFILFILIVLAILFHKSLSNFKKILQKTADERAARKQAEEDAYFKRTSTKHYREENKPKFKEDYFKGAEESRQQKPRQEQKPQPEATSRRTVNTDGGVTIIDDRGNQQADRKIFDDSDGEYVDFEEVNN